MKPINRKEVVVGSAWELRAKLTESTYENYSLVKTAYQNKYSKTYSDSAFIARLFDDLANLQRTTA